MNQQVQQALNNVEVIIANTPMKRNEHIELMNNLTLIKQRCEKADELEKLSAESEGLKKPKGKQNV